MLDQKYRLTLAFSVHGPHAEEDLLAAEDLLREELWTGLVAGHEIGEAGGRLFVVTPFPRRCLDDAAHRLRWLNLTPAGASFAALEESVPGDFRLSGEPEPLSINPEQPAGG